MNAKMLYRGALKQIGDFESLMAALKDIALSNNWSYEIIDTDWTLSPKAEFQWSQQGFQALSGLKGLLISLPSDFQLPFVFSASGQLMSIFQVAVQSPLHKKPHWISGSGQLASCHSEEVLQGVFAYLQKQFLPDLQYRWYPEGMLAQNGYSDLIQLFDISDKLKFI
ncbi:MAG: hypothetical protein MRY78_15580 [Saprospiraceae bacterium]|nr:hypothetical protein [Saprospiraceae bacterium]